MCDNIKIVIGSWGSYNECNERALGSKWLDLSDYHLNVCRINLRSLKVISIETLKTDYKRKARLLEPYINIVTEKFATYVSSKGTMRTPEALLTHKFLIRDIDEE